MVRNEVPICKYFCCKNGTFVHTMLLLGIVTGDVNPIAVIAIGTVIEILDDDNVRMLEVLFVHRILAMLVVAIRSCYYDRHMLRH